jgi:hypothetical protein
MTAKLGPSMIALGEPVSEPAATAISEEPLEYPFPGGKVPIIRASDRIVSRAPLNYPAPVAPGEAGSAGHPPIRDATFVQVSASIIAMAEPEPAVSFEQVAAVDNDAGGTEANRRELLGPGPTVIRGGVVDDGSMAHISVPAAPARKPATVQRPSSVASTQGAPGRSASPQAASSSRQQPSQPDVPIPSPTPAPPPPDIIPQTRLQ